MQVYLGLGSNLGDRRDHLSRAIDALEAKGLAIARVSPVVESPALLPDSAPNTFFKGLSYELFHGMPVDTLRGEASTMRRLNSWKDPMDGGKASLPAANVSGMKKA